MFTPKKAKVKPEWTLRSHAPSPRSAERGKSLASPSALNGRIPAKFGVGVGIDREAEDWRSFKKAGFLDESLIDKQDRDALVQKNSNLEIELKHYQHQMGLILIAKNELETAYNDLRQELDQAQELRKREQIAHLMALSQVEKREEKLSKELENGKHRAVDDADAMGKYLVKKEIELRALEEKLVARERVQNQRLYDEQNTERHEFQHEMDQKRRVVGEELRNRVAEVELKEVQVLQKTETVVQREQALEMKMAKYENKERELELKWETLREREMCLEAEETQREAEKKHMLTEKENLQVSNDELDKKRLDVDCKQQKLNNKIDNLKVTEEEKRELQRLQSELRQKKDECVLQEELFLKEQEILKQNKKKLEKEWEVLYQKKAEIETLLNQVNEEKKKFEKLKLSNEERLKNENLIAQEFIQSQLEALRSKKASFEATMERERSMLSEEMQTKHNQMLQEIELQKKELEIDMQNKLEKMEKNLLEKEKAMKEESEKELKDINHSKEEASKVIKGMSFEKLRIEKEMQEMAASKQFLEGQQIELRKEIDKLNILVKKLKDQSKGFKDFLEKNEKCKNCGEHINGFAHFDLHFLQEMGNIEISPLLRLSADYTSGNIKDSDVPFHSEPNHFHSECDTNPRPVVDCANPVNTPDEVIPPNPTLEPTEVKPPSVVPDVSAGINEGKRNTRRGVKRANPVKEVDEAAEVILGTTLEPIEGRHPSAIADVAADIGGGKRGINRRRGLKGANTVKAVNEGMEAVLGTTTEDVEGKHPSAITDVSTDINGYDNHAFNPRHGDKGANPVEVVDEDTIMLEPIEGKHPCGMVDISSDINGEKRDINPRHGVIRAKSAKAVDEDAFTTTTLESVEGEHQSGIDSISAAMNGNKCEVKPRRGVKRPKYVKAAGKDTDVMLGTILELVEGNNPSQIPDVSADVNENKHDTNPKHEVTQVKSVKAVENTVVLATAVESVKGKHLSGTADTHGGKRAINPRGGVKRAKSVKTVDEGATVILATSLEPIEGKHPSELTDTNQGKRAIKPRRGAKRENLVKSINEDKEVLLDTAQEVNLGTDVSAVINEDKPGAKPRRGGKRGNSVKAVVDTTQEPFVDKDPSGITDDSAGISGEGPEDSQCINRAPLPSYASGAATNHDSSELHSVSDSPSGSRKRRQPVTRGSKVSGENRYNLRRR